MIFVLFQRLMFTLIRAFEFLLIARAIISWLPMSGSNAIVEFLYNVTEPLLAPVRKLLLKIPALSNFPIDFSIIVVFILLDILRFIIIM